MRAYYYDNVEGDQRLPHDSGRAVAASDLANLGVLYHHFSEMSDVDALAKERGYKNRDEIIVSPDKMGAIYEEKVKSFFHEHLHEDEEIRYIRDGAGYFDVRNKGDDWVRIYLERDDLIILPAGIYHRFTTDETNYIKAMRLFQADPKWAAVNRGPESDEMASRKGYKQSYLGQNESSDPEQYKIEIPEKSEPSLPNQSENSGVEQYGNSGVEEYKSSEVVGA